MPYVPINSQVYSSAFAGFLAGATSGRIFNPSDTGMGALYTNCALVFAQEFDELYNSTTVDSITASMAQTLVTQYWVNRSSSSLSKNSYQNDCLSILGLLSQIDAALTAGVVPFPTSTVFDEVWDDAQGTIISGSGASALVQQGIRDTPFQTFFTRHDRDDPLDFVYQLSHRWDLQEVRPHIHVVPHAPSGGNVVWTGYYTWFRMNGSPIAPFASWIPWTKTYTYTAADQWIQRLAALDPIPPPADAVPSHLLLIRFLRNGSSIADTYNGSNPNGTAQANLCVLSSDVHFRLNKLGTVAEF